MGGLLLVTEQVSEEGLGVIEKRPCQQVLVSVLIFDLNRSILGHLKDRCIRECEEDGRVCGDNELTGIAQPFVDGPEKCQLPTEGQRRLRLVEQIEARGSEESQDSLKKRLTM
jgi:hypothetical protein